MNSQRPNPSMSAGLRRHPAGQAAHSELESLDIGLQIDKGHHANEQPAGCGVGMLFTKLWKQWLIVAYLSVVFSQSTAHAQIAYPRTSGGYMHIRDETPPAIYNAGYSLYSSAWPMLGDFPRDNKIQTGLFGTWMWPSRSIVDDHYTTIEGGLGWWRDRRFQTATPKYIMGGVTWGTGAWWYANGPGSGTTQGNGKYAVAQLSPSLLFPPDGLNLRQGTSGKLFGYGYLALPLTEPKTTTAGAAVPTGNHCWTLFMNTGNYKGPTAFFTPYYWSQMALIKPQLAGQGFDSRWTEADKGFAMESQETAPGAACDTADSTFVRSLPIYYPVDSDGYSLLMHRLSVYDQGALWNEVGQWLAATGPTPSGVIKSSSTFVQSASGEFPVWTVKNGTIPVGPLDWTGIVDSFSTNTRELGYQWKTDQLTVIPSANGSLVKLPEYYQGPTNASATSQWMPTRAENIPTSAAAALANFTFTDPETHNSVVAVDGDPVWTSPGPSSGPYRALLGDGSFVTYYWYRFAD